MPIHRHLLKTLHSRAQSYPVVAIIGPRQSGKTTLARMAFPAHPHISLEDLDNRAFAQEDPRGFLKQYKQGVVIDEIQREPNLLSYMQTEVDNDPAPGRFIVTGSNQFLLMKNVSQSLAGRISLLRLLPLSWSELAGSSYQHSDLNEWLHTGSYPRIYDSSLDGYQWIADYIDTYVEKDLKDFIRVSDLSAFRRLLTCLASSCGQLLNLSSLGNELGISHSTIKSWIDALEASFLIFRLQPFHQNYKKRLVKTAKIYFYDTGLIMALLGIRTKEDLARHFIRGQVFENWAIVEKLKALMNKGEKPNLYFWRDHVGNEVDLIEFINSQVIATEIKSSQTINSQFFKGLSYLKNLAGDDPITQQLVYGGDTQQDRSDVTVIPWQSWSTQC
jgi:predicted AAA+ superfamily ATPase